MRERGREFRSVQAWPAPDLLKPPQKLQAGEVLVTGGAEVRALYLIEDGVFERFVWLDGDERLDGIRSKGWLLGVVPALTGRRHGRIVSMTDAVVRPLPLAAFLAALPDSALNCWLVEFLAQELARQQERAAALAARSTKSLIEALFVELFTAAGRRLSTGDVRLTVDVPVVKVSRLVGASREHASRVLTELEADGTLRRVRDWFMAPASSRLVARLDSGRH